jgi:2-polyprenyl-3-methyl-5-hydroxy-6-metoxy-1,4-benzoquinol methylase
MPLLSQYAQKKKTDYFLKKISKQDRILEIGCGTGWVRNYLKENGWKNYVGIDLVPPADIIGDIRDWENLGLTEETFDIIIAFEVVEHVNCLKECYKLLKSGGKLMLTSPVPHMDWILNFLELIGLNQKRTSPHNNLIYFKDCFIFENKDTKIVGFSSQWGIFTK